MLGLMSSPAPTWTTRNVQVLTAFGPLLILTGVAGFLLPPALSLMSGAPPYNVFHLLAGAIGLAIALGRRRAAAIRFNAVFGAIDLYQAAAGLLGWFPARWFGLRPADHVVHVVIGVGLVALAHLGRREAEA